MKASKLIKILKEFVKEHGDCSVGYWLDDSHLDFSAIRGAYVTGSNKVYEMEMDDGSKIKRLIGFKNKGIASTINLIVLR